MRKLSLDDEQAIRNLRLAHPNLTLRELGIRFSVSPTAIFNVLNGRPIKESFVKKWTGLDAPPARLPVVDGGFIRPPTRERLMAGR